MSKRASTEPMAGPSTKRGGSSLHDLMEKTVGMDEKIAERELAVKLQNLEGGGGGAGNMPPTSLNNPFSGHIVIAVPDIMAAPVNLTYRDVWLVIRNQHPLASGIADVGITGSPQIQITVRTVELYGASSGIISMAPWIQRAVPQYAGLATSNMQYIGEQLIDLGTIDQKPYLVHSFGNGTENTRIVNITPIDAANFAMDNLITYQVVQKVANATPVDAAYLRVSFTLKVGGLTSFLNVEDVIPTPVVPPLSQLGTFPADYETMTMQCKDRSERVKTLRKIAEVKQLTLPTLD